MISIDIMFKPHDKRLFINKNIIEINDWLRRLPTTKRGNYAYRVRHNVDNIFDKLCTITFVRREDAMAFRLKFNL